MSEEQFHLQRVRLAVNILQDTWRHTHNLVIKRLDFLANHLEYIEHYFSGTNEDIVKCILYNIDEESIFAVLKLPLSCGKDLYQIQLDAINSWKWLIEKIKPCYFSEVADIELSLKKIGLYKPPLRNIATLREKYFELFPSHLQQFANQVFKVAIEEHMSDIQIKHFVEKSITTLEGIYQP